MRFGTKILAHLTMLALIPAAIVTAQSEPAQPASASSSASRIKLQIVPSSIPLGGHFTVRLAGLRAAEPVVFTLHPLQLKGFGGGLMGRWKADTHGVIRFSYPGGTQRWELGRWRVSAQGMPEAQGMLATATLVFVPR